MLVSSAYSVALVLSKANGKSLTYIKKRNGTRSGEIGLGIFYKGKWISERWPDSVKTNSIQWKELFPIYIAWLLWAPEFRGKRLLFHCDNLAVVNIWSAQSSKCPNLMSLLIKLFFIAARFEFTVNVKHIACLDNSIADCLSRLQLDKFFRIVPVAQKHPTQIPAHAWQIWKMICVFSSSCRLQQVHVKHTSKDGIVAFHFAPRWFIQHSQLQNVRFVYLWQV